MGGSRICCMSRIGEPVDQFLRARLLTVFGKYSYGIYVYQGVVFVITLRKPTPGLRGKHICFAIVRGGGTPGSMLLLSQSVG